MNAIHATVTTLTLAALLVACGADPAASEADHVDATEVADSAAAADTVVLSSAYFGGDEKAPQSIKIEVRGIVADERCVR